MKLFKQILAVVLCGFALGAAASPAAPVAGSDYVVLKEPQPTEAGKKVEVIEFFAYYCPHCNALEPSLEAWVKKQGDNIVFKRVHVSRGASVLPQQKLFFTLEALGLLGEKHQKAFDAMGARRVFRAGACLALSARSGLCRDTSPRHPPPRAPDDGHGGGDDRRRLVSFDHRHGDRVPPAVRAHIRAGGVDRLDAAAGIRLGKTAAHCGTGVAIAARPPLARR